MINGLPLMAKAHLTADVADICARTRKNEEDQT